MTEWTSLNKIYLIIIVNITKKIHSGPADFSLAKCIIYTHTFYKVESTAIWKEKRAGMI